MDVNNFIKLGTGFNITASVPVDYRSIVTYQSDLYKASFSVPQGFIATVLHNTTEPASNDTAEAKAAALAVGPAVYYLEGADPTNSASWVKLAVDGNQYAATGLKFKGSYTNATTAEAALNTPLNGWYYFAQDTNKFRVYNESWGDLCTLSGAGIVVTGVDSLSYTLDYNGVNIPTSKPSGKGNTHASASNFVAADEKNVAFAYISDNNSYKATITLPVSNFKLVDSDFANNTQVRLKLDIDSLHTDTVDDSAVQAFIRLLEITAPTDDAKNAPIKISENAFDYWNKGQIIDIVYNSEKRIWCVVDSCLSSNFTFSKTIESFNWKNYCSSEHPNATTMSDMSDVIFDTLVKSAKTDENRGKLNFINYDGRKVKYDAEYDENNKKVTIQFITSSYLHTVIITKDETALNPYSYSNSFSNILADSTTTIIEEGNGNPISSGAVYTKFKPLYDSLTWFNV